MRLVVFLSFLFLGCVSLPAQADPVVLCVAGDSLAHSGPSGSWADRLPDERYTTIYEGTPGSTTSNWLPTNTNHQFYQRIERCMNQDNASHLSLNLGTNDRFWNIPPGNQFLQYTAITQSAIELGYHQVFLFKVEPYAEFTQVICDSFPEATCIDQLGLLPHTLEFYADIGSTGLGIHPNALGQQILADEVERLTVPEPGVPVLLGAGLVGLVALGRRRG